MRTIEEVLREKRRKLETLGREINTLEAAAKILEAEDGKAAVISGATEPGLMPSVAVNPVPPPPQPKHWP